MTPVRAHTVRRSAQSRRQKRSSSHRPHIFGRGGRDRALVALAVNGALHVRHLARVIDSDSRCTWAMVERLRASGIVVKRFHSGGRKYVQLNKELSCYPALTRLLSAVDRRWPVTRTEQTSRWYMPFSGRITDKQREQIFQSDVRSRVLLFVHAVHATNITDMLSALHMHPGTALYVVDAWEREGVLRSQRIGQHRVVDLVPSFPVATELRAFLEMLVRESAKYAAFRELYRGRQRTYRVGRRPS